MTNQLIEIIKKYDMNGFKGNYSAQGEHLGGWGTDKDAEHSYCEYYEQVLKPFVKKKVNILELGANYGCSGILWYEFLPKSKLVMLDIAETMNPKCWEIMDNDRFIYANCDAYVEENSEEVKKLQPKGFDIIFEDGPHTVESQVATLELYLEQLKVGGKMFIEDVQDPNHFDILEKVVEEIDGEYETEQIDLRENKDRYDDLIFVVTKK